MSDQTYFKNVVVLENWCKLNVRKTKELIFNINSGEHDVLGKLMLNDKAVEIVESFKYLGTYLDTRVSFGENVDTILKKAGQSRVLMLVIPFWKWYIQVMLRVS